MAIGFKRGILGQGVMPGDQPAPEMVGDDPFGLKRPMPAAQPASKKPGFFDQGGAGRSIAGALGDYLLQVNGMDPVYAPQMQDHAKLLRQQALMEAGRANKFADWKRQYDYERSNPKQSSTPYRWESNDGDVYEMGPQGPTRIFDDPTPRMNFIPDGMGGGRWVPLPGATQGPVGKLTPINPNEIGGVGGAPAGAPFRR